MEHLTPEGAARLRAVRRRFVERPEDYCFQWRSECGTRVCVGGWLMADAGITYDSWIGDVMPELLGLAQFENAPSTGSVSDLFLGHRTPAQAIARIDEFLWHFGYPPEEAGAPVGEAVAV